MKKRTVLREMLRKKEFIVAPFVSTVVDAKIVEYMGMDSVYLSGFGMEASLVGVPDIGLQSVTERVMFASNVVDTVNIPVIVDMEQGFGRIEDVNTIMRSVRLAEKAGVAAYQIDDQGPRMKCPLYTQYPPAELLTIDQACKRIRACVEAREDKDLLIIVRIDVFGAGFVDFNVSKVEEVVKRAKAYVEAGADSLWPYVPNEEAFKKVREAVPDTPLGALSPAPKDLSKSPHRAFMWTPTSLEDAKKHGYQMAFCAGAFYVGAKAWVEALKELKEKGYISPDRSLPFKEWYDILEGDKYYQIYKRYL